MFCCAQFIFMIFICIPYCYCQNVSEIQEIKETVLEVDSWLLRRFSKIRNEEKFDTKFRLSCKPCFDPNEWSGLKIDIYYNFPIEDVKDDYPIKFKPLTNHVTISLPNISKIRADELKYDFRVYFKDKNEPPVDNMIKSFYVNDVLKAGVSQIIDNEQHSTSLSGRRQCSFFIKSVKSNERNKAIITIQHSPTKDYEGITLILIFQQFMKIVKLDNFHTRNQEGNQWALQNYGLNGEANNVLTGEIELEAPELILDPYPLAIMFNGEILCGLPLIDTKQGTAVVSFSDFINMVKLNEENHHFLVASIALIIFLTLLLIGGFGFILYMCKKWRFFSSSFNSERNPEIKNFGQLNQTNNFDQFVTAEYENI